MPALGTVLALLVAGTGGALILGLPSTQTPLPVEVSPRLNVVIPIYNDRGLEAVRTSLRPYLRRDDVFLLVSGNQDDQIDAEWVDRSAEVLRTFYPGTTILAGTSGMANISLGIAGIRPPVEGLAYIYEPEFSNEPEFSWDFATTQRLFDEVAAKTRSAGFRAIGKPTGRPLLAVPLSGFEWDYAELGATMDDLFVQTQAYCHESVATYEEAIGKLIAQFGESGSDRWLPQITLDLNSRHGVSVERALACAERAKEMGVRRFLMWWSGAHAENAAAFLKGIRP
ncbi:MAG: hypothetical protein WED86_05650 [Chloroflexota bacterium]